MGGGGTNSQKRERDSRTADGPAERSLSEKGDEREMSVWTPSKLLIRKMSILTLITRSMIATRNYTVFVSSIMCCFQHNLRAMGPYPTSAADLILLCGLIWSGCHVLPLKLCSD